MNTCIDVAAAVILNNGKLFSAKRSSGMHLEGYWEFPGGKLEDGESPEQCLVRELEEELCVKAEIGRYIGESVYDYGTKIVRLLAYQVRILEGDIQLIDHEEFRWLTVEELDCIEWAPADVPLLALCREVMISK
ncbi:NUDIX domain-containing protein [Seongchinamella sediminis]|uniref:8-oxo-dGTP diphosphatase n=2 Tax=Seongchinamella sediminis TaxID=2283635 RepID=A0A3L7E204_9GAMM|nr:NUDIX domain-containing protein [Seongchinamella sediminis]